MHNKKKNRVKVILPCLGIMIILVAAALLLLRLRGSVIIKPDQVEFSSGKVMTYRQDDGEWADRMLGDSRFTMRSSGCLVTCIASAVSMETDTVVTPGVLNDLFSENQVYDSEGNIQWAAIEKIDGYFVDVFQEVSGSGIIQSLSSGHYPIARVRMRGLGNYHYVLIVGVEDGEYLCMDPLEDQLTKLSRYWNRVYAVRMVSCSQL